MATIKLFTAFLRATGRERVFFPEKIDMEKGWSAPSPTAEEQTLTEFAVMRVMAGCTPDTAGGAVSNIRTWCELMLDRKYGRVGNQQKASLTSDFLKAMKVSKFYAEKDSADLRREPITWTMVMMFVRAAEEQRRRDVGIAIAIAYAGLFRMGELTSSNELPFSPTVDLSERDVIFHPTFWTATTVVFNIGRTKTDYDGSKGKLRPRTLPVEPGSPGDMLRHMLARRHGVTKGDDPVLRPVLLFQNSKRGHLTRDGVIRFIRETLKQAGWTEARRLQYGTHSCRIGGCTALFEIGASAETIQSMGGWSSDAYKLYIRLQQKHLLSYARRMCT